MSSVSKMLSGMKTINVIGAFRSVFCHSSTSLLTSYIKADVTITFVYVDLVNFLL